MKKLFAILFILILPICVFGQSEEADDLYEQAEELYDAERYEEAIQYYQKCDLLDKEVLEPTSDNYYRAELGIAYCLYNLALDKYEQGNIREAIKLDTQAMNIFKKVLGEETSDYAISLGNLAFFYSALGNNSEAIRLGTQAIEIKGKVLGEEHPNYALSLNNLAEYYNDLGNNSEAIRLCTQAMEIFKKVLGEEHPDYATSLSNLASYYSDLGNYTEAIKLCIQAMEIRKKVLGEEHPDYAISLSNMASYYYALGNYTEAIRLGIQAMEIRKKVLGEEHPDYASSLNNLASFYDNLGNYTEAIRLCTQAMEIMRKDLGEEHPDYATSLNNLASYYSDLGNYTEAIRLCAQAMEIREKVLGEEHPDYAISLSNLASYYSELGNYTEAIRLCTQAMEIMRKVLGEEHLGYATLLNNLAGYYSELGNYTEAIRLCTQALEIKGKVLGNEHLSYATSLSNLATFFSALGNYTESIRLCTQAMEIFKKFLGEEHLDYATSLNNLAEYYLYCGKYEEATALFEQAYKRYESLILQTFAYLTNKERSDYWGMYSCFFIFRLPSFATVCPNSTIKGLVYDGQVLAKGLLLNAELEIQNLIEKQGNEQMKERYYYIKQSREILDELYQLAPAQRPMDADSLQRVIEKEERLLIESSKELGDYTKSLSLKWTDVQKTLNDNDVAIEFLNIQDTADVDTYFALVLKKGMESPELVQLFAKEDFAAVNSSDYYNTPNLYNLVWKPLEQYLDGVNNVYFSPSGKFHTIGIEYLPNEQGEIFANKYNAYRLSSTRELAISRETNPNKMASVYGGIVYNFDESDWQNVSDDADEAERGGKGLTFLKAAKKESEEITTILKNGSFDVVYGTDKAATEDSFKKLSGRGIKIMHIATHGFYEPEEKEKVSAKKFTIENKSSQEDRSLNRSGLYFAGANTALDPEQRKFIPDGVDDGILTAKEISRMDFKGLDLVVLSACQTGLGEVTSEGVFGLQRGFKKAGAQTIIMSLWNVSDKPTRELMTEFYRNLVAGKSKREAFISAQDKIRLKYINPQMWAGFIMVDGIEY